MEEQAYPAPLQEAQCFAQVVVVGELILSVLEMEGVTGVPVAEVMALKQRRAAGAGRFHLLKLEQLTLVAGAAVAQIDRQQAQGTMAQQVVLE